MWVKQPNFLELKNNQTSDSLQMVFKKMKTYNLGKLTYVFFFLGGGDIYFTYQFLEDQKVSCEFLKKISDLSDLTPDVRSYTVLRYLWLVDPDPDPCGQKHGDPDPEHWYSDPARFQLKSSPPDAVHVAVPAVGGVCWGGEALQLGGQNGLPQLVEAQPGLLSTLLQLVTKIPHLAKFRTFEKKIENRNP